MAKLAAQLKDRFFGLVSRITSCGRAHHNDAAAGATDPGGKPAPAQRNEIRSRGGAPSVSGGSKPRSN